MTIEIYRRQELLELDTTEWRMALLIFKEMGWRPERQLDSYALPLMFVKDYEGHAMHQAGQTLFAVIADEPFICLAVQMDLGLFYRISEFVGGGSFIIGKKGSYVRAKRDSGS